MVMIGSNTKKVNINHLQSYHMGIQEKEKRVTAVTTAAPPVQNKSGLRDVVARNYNTSPNSFESGSDSEPSEPTVSRSNLVKKGHPPDRYGSWTS